LHCTRRTRAQTSQAPLNFRGAQTSLNLPQRPPKSREISCHERVTPCPVSRYARRL